MPSARWCMQTPPSAIFFGLVWSLGSKRSRLSRGWLTNNLVTWGPAHWQVTWFLETCVICMNCEEGSPASHDTYNITVDSSRSWNNRSVQDFSKHRPLKLITTVLFIHLFIGGYTIFYIIQHPLRFFSSYLLSPVFSISHLLQ